jgi:Zn-dependent protease
MLLIILPPILFALTFHEYAHAWTSYRLGDPTAQSQGRLTLNPMAHLDPAGTVMLIITVLSGFGLGWARPVPVDPRYLKNPRRDMMWIALAGPASNVLLAFILGGLVFTISPGSEMVSIFRRMVGIGVSINLNLAFFNLIPIPPLDGSRILVGLLPARQAYQYSQLEMYGPILLITLIMADYMLNLNLIQTWIYYPVSFLEGLIVSLFT